VSDIQAEGEGALAAAFENLKKKLSEEGLFDPAHKKTLPAFPKKIGVVTSPTGAVIKDISQTLRRRNPMVEILLYPALVQGQGSAATVCEGIKFFNEKRPDTDIIIIGRGGGSLEDLWTFNEESVARAVYDSRIPVISAVGHESDFVISDMVADLRASTPTAAAELCAPHIDNLKDRARMCSPYAVFEYLNRRIELEMSTVRRLRDNLDNAALNKLSALSNRLSLAGIELRSSAPMAVLGSGYAAVKDSDGKWRSRAEGLSAGDRIKLVFSDGSADCTVDEVFINE
jgi:exodeoxyribonuclease VII large subunit